MMWSKSWSLATMDNPARRIPSSRKRRKDLVSILSQLTYAYSIQYNFRQVSDPILYRKGQSRGFRPDWRCPANGPLWACTSPINQEREKLKENRWQMGLAWLRQPCKTGWSQAQSLDQGCRIRGAIPLRQVQPQSGGRTLHRLRISESLRHYKQEICWHSSPDRLEQVGDRSSFRSLWAVQPPLYRHSW